MPKPSKHTKDEIYKSIMGNELKDTAQEESEMQSITDQGSEVNPVLKQSKKIESDLDNLVHKSYYITKRHVKALKLRTAISDKPEEKDFSAIVRAALDLYLADTLKEI